MTAAARVAVFGLLLAVVLAASLLVGRAAGVAPRSVDDAGPAHGEGEVSMGGAAAPAGLSVSDGGLTLVPERATLAVGVPEPFVFSIRDEDGDTVRDFDVAHERRMHLIVVRRDLTGFQHLHPAQRADGSWASTLTLTEAGAYRAFADFEVGGVRRTLGVDLSVPGADAPRRLPSPSHVATAAPYQVELDRDGAMLRFRVARDGKRVLPEPYLGARGHLVVLREGDLAFVHAHPEPGASAGAGTSYEAELPSAGRYAVYLQFSHGGSVHTALFTVVERP